MCSIRTLKLEHRIGYVRQCQTKSLEIIVLDNSILQKYSTETSKYFNKFYDSKDQSENNLTSMLW